MIVFIDRSGKGARSWSCDEVKLLQNALHLVDAFCSDFVGDDVVGRLDGGEDGIHIDVVVKRDVAPIANVF